MAPLCLQEVEVLAWKVQGFPVDKLGKPGEQLLIVTKCTKCLGENWRKLRFCKK